MAQVAREVSLDLVLALVAATAAVTCATTGEIVPLEGVSPRQPPVVAAARGPTEPVVPASPAGAAAPPPSPTGSAGAVGDGRAPRPWRGAFEALTNRSRSESVHVVWLGDSHTAADFWTQGVRDELQARYGNGGPGFLRLGISPYRHGRAKIVSGGRWRRVPSAPARVTPTGDGVFALGGMRAEPVSADARVAVELYGTAVRGAARWDLAFRFPKAEASFELVLDDEAPIVVDARDGSGAAVRHLEVTGQAGGELVLRRFAGAVELFGVTVEGTEPGAVLDTIGIDGARIGTLLAWDEPTFVAELARRDADFVVLAFGTNEAFAEEDVARYADQYGRVMARVRAAAPDAGCALLGPTNVPGRDGPDGRIPAIDRVQARAAAAAGCTFISLHELMGGEGSFGLWMRASPPLAADDGVHLLQSGYERLGHEVLERLLGAP